MNCPYCAEEIKDQALRCKSCGQDLTIIRPLLSEIQLLSARLETIETSLATLMSSGIETRPVDSFARQASKFYAISDWAAVLISILGIAIAHYLVVVVFDANPDITLRPLSIILTFCMGLLRRSSPGRSVFSGLGIAVVLALCALLEMSYVQAWHYKKSVLPEDALEWLQLLQYGASIALGFFAGVLAGVLLRRRFENQPASRFRARGVLSQFFPNSKPNDISTEKFEKAITRIESIVRSLITLAGTIGALITSAYLGISQHLIGK